MELKQWANHNSNQRCVTGGKRAKMRTFKLTVDPFFCALIG